MTKCGNFLVRLQWFHRWNALKIYKSKKPSSRKLLQCWNFESPLYPINHTTLPHHKQPQERERDVYRNLTTNSWQTFEVQNTYPLGRLTSPRDGHCGGRYASYWNAFFYHDCLWENWFSVQLDFSVQNTAKKIRIDNHYITTDQSEVSALPAG